MRARLLEAPKERPATVRLKYGGEFRLGPDKAWMPYESQTYYTTDPPAFLWTVGMRMFPLVSVIGRDRYVDGEGSIRMKVLSLVPVADKRGGGLNQGALLRYLGETVWFPAGAVAPYITWAPHDANSATFRFDHEGRVTAEEDGSWPLSSPRCEGVRWQTAGSASLS
jgi:Family of unknown function (DUF6544)